MADLLQTARLFEVGTRLQTASSNLMTAAQGNSPEAAALRWAGNFLCQVDWSTGPRPEGGVDGGLAVSAANARPKFYASLMRIAPRFQAVGIDSEKQVYSFLKSLYAFLKSGGSDIRDLSSERLTLAAEFLRVLSESIMVDLCDNGLPKREPVLTLGEFTL